MGLNLWFALSKKMASPRHFTNNVFASEKAKLSNTAIDPMGGGN